MVLRDYLVYGLLILIIGGMLAYALWALLRPAQGAWNEHDKELGQYRAKRWTYKKQAPNLKAHLLGSGVDTHYWPALANAVGYDALCGTDKQRNISWASAIVKAIGDPQRMYMSVHLPLRSDAHSPDLPEMLLTKVNAQSEESLPDYLADWKMTAAEQEAAQELLSIMPQALTYDSELVYLHTAGETVTFVRSYRPSENRVKLIERYLDKAAAFSLQIPEKFWV